MGSSGGGGVLRSRWTFWVLKGGKGPWGYELGCVRKGMMRNWYGRLGMLSGDLCFEGIYGAGVPRQDDFDALAVYIWLEKKTD